MAKQDREGARTKPLQGPLLLSGYRVDEHLHQCRDIFFAIAQGRQGEGDGAQPIVDFRQKRPRKHLTAQRFPRSADKLRRARLTAWRLRRKRCFKSANVAQKLGLRLGGQSVDVADQQHTLAGAAKGSPHRFRPHLAVAPAIG
jgi:hypothetical protein